MTHWTIQPQYISAACEGTTGRFLLNEDGEFRAQLLSKELAVKVCAALNLADTIANFTQDGERDADGHQFNMEADDSIDTLRDLIDQARNLGVAP